MDQQGTKHVFALMALLGALILSGMLVLAGLNAGHASAATDGTPMAAEVDAILAQPRGFLLKNVSVRGEVMRVWGTHVVALHSHSVHQGLLIVLGEQSVSEAGLRVGQRVEVTGKVRPICRAEVQALRQGLTTDVGGDSLLAIFGGDPYILADGVRSVR